MPWMRLRSLAPLVLLTALVWNGATARAQVRASKIQFDQRSKFERVLVVDEGDSRFLRFGGVDGDDQSMITLSDPKAVPMEYIRLASLATMLVPKVERVLMLGVGGGTFGTHLHQRYPRAHIDGVDIDPIVVKVAYEYFRVPKSARYVMHVQDGAKFIAKGREPYDVILLDAYGADGVPPSLASVSFFETVAKRLNPQGVVVLNLSLGEDEEVSLANRFATVFPHVLCAATSDGYNVLLYGSRRPLAERNDTERPLRALPNKRVPGGCGQQH